MASTSFHTQEGHSTNRPPLFDGNDYNYWKARMTIYLQSIDYNLWEVIENGPYVPMKLIKEEGKPDRLVLKEKHEYEEEDKRKLSLNARAKNVLYCALDKNEFNRICMCDSAQDIWNLLEITHIGTSQVKETKINMLVTKYENFFMKENEAIVDMITRFTDIINGLKALDRKLTNDELVSKILRSLPESWTTLKTVIETTKTTQKYTIEELYGVLMTHELNMAETKDKTSKNKDQVEERPKRQIALKSTSEEEDKSEGLDESEMEDLMALLGKFNRFKGFRKTPRRNDKGGNKDPIIYYECKKPRHKGDECPQLQHQQQQRKFGKKKKALQVITWDDSEEEDQEEEKQEEIANMCFMALNDEVEIQNTLVDDDTLYDELSIAYDELLTNFEKLATKATLLKKKNASLSIELEKISVIEKENENLRNENISLKERVDDLTKVVYKFTLGKKTFDMMISEQRCVFNKQGLGFKPTLLANYFFKASSSSRIICHYCNDHGHTSFDCHIKKSMSHGSKYKWIKKSTTTNTIGPKLVWVPKIKT